MDQKLQQLAALHPWPRDRPDVPEDWFGWFDIGTMAMLNGHVKPEMSLIVELGTFLGYSTRFLLGKAKRATVISIDHGAKAMAGMSCASNPDIAKRLPTLDQVVYANLWPWRDRCILVRMPTIGGMHKVFLSGRVPDLVYIDACHETPACLADILVADALWPRTTMVGDDLSWPTVASAVSIASAATGRTSSYSKTAWSLEPKE